MTPANDIRLRSTLNRLACPDKVTEVSKIERPVEMIPTGLSALSFFFLTYWAFLAAFFLATGFG